MPLTMTAEREDAIRDDSGKGHWIRQLLAELDAERAAHQETQAIAVRVIGERDTLQKKLAETQAKLAGAHENADALLVRLGGDPEGMSDAEVWHASAKAIAETQAIARELTDALNSAGGAVKLLAQIELSWKHADGSTVEVEGLVTLLTEIQTLIARAKGVLPAQNTLPPAGSAASGDEPVSGGHQS